MPNTVTSELAVRALVTETLAGDMGTTRRPLTWPSITTFFYASGTGNSQADHVWADTRTAAGVADSIDLSGSLTSPVNGAAVVFAEICFVGVYVVTATSGYTLSIGGGSTPVACLANSTPIGPASLFIWSNWVNGVAVAAGVSDLLKLDPGANTITYDLLLIGRSA